jgi:tRNA pseudouridine38-40 synthase
MARPWRSDRFLLSKYDPGKYRTSFDDTTDDTTDDVIATWSSSAAPMITGKPAFRCPSARARIPGMGSRIKLTVAYLGERFHGWQRQADRRTVQGELERAVEAMTGGLAATIVGAGRTDAGVHAAGQVAHIDPPVAIPASGLLKGLNQRLPREIRVRAVRGVTTAFHARSSALAKLYTYRARWHDPGMPWLGLRTATVTAVTDLVSLTAALRLLEGRRNVASFSVPEAADGPTERTLFRVWLERRRSGVDLHFMGDGFLRYQVRRMVGALLDVGRGNLDIEEFRRLLDEPQPGAPVHTAPARGLSLERVLYRRGPALRRWS